MKPMRFCEQITIIYDIKIVDIDHVIVEVYKYAPDDN